MLDTKQLPAILGMLDDGASLSDHRRKQLLSCLRNVCFEYEGYEEVFIRASLDQQLVKLLVREQGIAQLPSEWSHLEGVATREKFLKQIDMDNTKAILDALILLINSDKFLNRLHEANFGQMLRCVKSPAFGETVEKIDLINGQLASAGGPDPELKTEEVKEDEDEAKPAAPEVTPDDLD